MFTSSYDSSRSGSYFLRNFDRADAAAFRFQIIPNNATAATAVGADAQLLPLGIVCQHQGTGGGIDQIVMLVRGMVD